jgi:4-hydroxybenzoate polyprenyltransferase
LVKDLENFRGDFAQGYQTIPVVFGNAFTKKIITAITLFAAVPTLTLILGDFPIGYMLYYFIFAFLVLLIFLYFLWKSQAKIQYVLLHNLLKFIIVVGAFSIILIDVNVVLERI